MPPNHPPLLEEIHRLTQENNRLLHKMRRGALWGRIFTMLFYTAIFLAPVWFYLTYLNGTVQNLLQAYERTQGAGQQAQGEFQQIQQALQQFQSKFQSFSATSSPHQQ
jgi:predicted PurR-regulated permease PerM